MTASDSPDTLNNSQAAGSPAEKPAANAPGKPEQALPAEDVAAEIAALQTQLAAARKEAADNHDRFLRAVADLENFRKRTVREKDELRQYAIAKVLEDLLPALDNLALALDAAKKPAADAQSISSGIAMVQDKLKSSLSGHGLKEINPAGQAFDPHQHESVAQQPSDTVPEGAVLQVVRTGYSLNGRLLRPAMVVLSSGPAASPAPQTGAS